MSHKQRNYHGARVSPQPRKPVNPKPSASWPTAMLEIRKYTCPDARRLKNLLTLNPKALNPMNVMNPKP